jgi:hypothetical protein
MEASVTVLRKLVMASLFACVSAAAPSASAAESYDSCSGFVDTVPVVITTQGTWCLRHDIATSLNPITAIDIQTSNVTIDCNGFKLGGLSAGPGTTSTAIYAYGTLSNITVRRCNIRGFRFGISIYANDPGTGHVVEDNRLEQMTAQGIYVIGHGSVVRRNTVINTGGAPGTTQATAISVLGDAVDNVVDGMFGEAGVTNFAPTGIYSGGVGGISGFGFLVKGNRVRNLVPKGTGEAWGLALAGYAQSVRDNILSLPTPSNGKGVYCSLGGEDVLRDNIIRNFSQGTYGGCSDQGGNVIY